VSCLFEPTSYATDKLDLHLVILGFDFSVEVKAGENRGRTLNHNFVVLGYKQVSLEQNYNVYTGEMVLPKPQKTSPHRYALAAWVSYPGKLSPIQATGGWLPIHTVQF
jgi:hypothetical protein